MKIVYIAGPYRAKTAWGVAKNIRNAEMWGYAVAEAGAMPLIPHANSAHFDGEFTDEFWLDGTMELLRRCDGILLMPNWQESTGAKHEALEAERLDMPELDMACMAAEPSWVRRFVLKLEGAA